MASQDLTVGAGEFYETIQSALDFIDGETGDHILRLKNQNFPENITVNNGSAAWTSVTIQPADGAEHDGRTRTVSGTGAQITGTTRTLRWFNGNNATLVIKDICIVANGAAAIAAVDVTDTGAHITVERSVLAFEQISSNTGYALLVGGSPIVIARDNIIPTVDRAIDMTTAAAGSKIEHNTIVGDGVNGGSNSDYGVLADPDVEVNNNIVVGFSVECYFGSSPSADYNIASDTSANPDFGANSIDDANVYETGEGSPSAPYVAFEDIDFASANFLLTELASGTNVALGAGASGKGSGFDILGNPRHPTAPDIGAHQYSPVGGGGSLVAGSLGLTGVGL